jgi:6-phosphogluconate dehydrogenase
MSNVLGIQQMRWHEVFAKWNETELDSYLIEITADILAFKDTDGLPLVDKILDTAGQKGTGKWTAVSSLDEGVPLTLIGEAVYARFISALKDERVYASSSLKKHRLSLKVIKKNSLKILEKRFMQRKSFHMLKVMH